MPSGIVILSYEYDEPSKIGDVESFLAALFFFTTMLGPIPLLQPKFCWTVLAGRFSVIRHIVRTLLRAIFIFSPSLRSFWVEFALPVVTNCSCESTSGYKNCRRT